MKTKPVLEQKPKQQQTLNLALQQALYVLQLPIMELAAWVQLQIEENPLLRLDDMPPIDLATELDFETQGFEVLDHLDDNFIQGAFPDLPEESPSLENLLPASTSLHHYLMGQAQSTFSCYKDISHAEQIIGNLDSQGFLGDFKADPYILAKIQEFDPPGIAARSLQESLLIQLKAKGKESSLAYILVSHHFEDLLRCRWTSITRKIPASVKEIQEALRKELSSLDFHPASKFHPTSSTPIIPDIILDPTDSSYLIKINEDPLPRFTLTPPSAPHLNHYYAAGKWMKHILRRRHKMLTQIMHSLLEKHPEFFFEAANPHPLPMRQIAQELGLHTSTIARAVKDKYLVCPQGTFPIKHFFPHTSSIKDEGKTISHLAARQLIQDLIAAEDKKKPFSDNALVQLMTEAGIPCARRTIAKYRRVLHIPTSSQRKINH